MRTLFVMLPALMILITLFPTHAQQSSHCSFCGGELHGKYWKLPDGGLVCAACKARLPECSRCGLPSGQLWRDGDARLCPQCLKEVQRCTLCGDPLLGRYWEVKRGTCHYTLCESCNASTAFCAKCGTALTGPPSSGGGPVFCRSCMNRLPTCSICRKSLTEGYIEYKTANGPVTVCHGCNSRSLRCYTCGLPFSNGYNIDGDHVCSSCFPKLPQCSACATPIVSVTYSFAGSDNIYCARCTQDRRPCDVCGEPLGDAYDQLSDGRAICLACGATAVMDTAEAEALFDAVVKILDHLLKMKFPARPAFKFVDLPTLLAQIEDDPSLRGEERTLGLFMRKGRKTSVWVVAGLPRRRTVAVMAHELAHAWQNANCAGESSKLLSEGFAEWVAYKVLEAMRADKEMGQMLRREDLYGRGFKNMLAIEQKSGIAGVMRRACSDK